MARFVFQLEGVLRHRRNLERDRQRELAEREKDVQAVKAEVERLNTEVRDVTADVRAHLSGRLDLEFLTAHRRFMLAMQRRGIDLVQRLREAQKRSDETRLLLAEAARQRKVIEKLRENHFERWRANLAAKEMAELDEIGMQLAFRQSREEAQEPAEETS